jgi:hypothetical protein
MIRPIAYIWREVEIVDLATGESTQCRAMVPKPRYAKLASEQHLLGEEYILEDASPTTLPGHSANHAQLNEYFKNLPEKYEARWPKYDHFRRWLLIQEGWFTESEIDCADEKMARQTAALVRSFDGYARISVHDSKVIVRRARSQKVKGPRVAGGMTKDEWKESWKDILELAAQFVGVSPSQMKREARKIA